jgi:hypothetical protein
MIVIHNNPMVIPNEGFCAGHNIWTWVRHDHHTNKVMCCECKKQIKPSTKWSEGLEVKQEHEAPKEGKVHMSTEMWIPQQLNINKND